MCLILYRIFHYFVIYGSIYVFWVVLAALIRGYPVNDVSFFIKNAVSGFRERNNSSNRRVLIFTLTSLKSQAQFFVFGLVSFFFATESKTFETRCLSTSYFCFSFYLFYALIFCIKSSSGFENALLSSSLGKGGILKIYVCSFKNCNFFL